MPYLIYFRQNMPHPSEETSPRFMFIMWGLAGAMIGDKIVDNTEFAQTKGPGMARSAGGGARSWSELLLYGALTCSRKRYEASLQHLKQANSF